MTTIKKYWLFTLLGTLAASAYPLYMGFSVLYDMAVQGTVSEENFPKYIIPYTPIAIAVITAVFLMPLLLKISERACVFIATALSLGVFFVSELLFESYLPHKTFPKNLSACEFFSLTEFFVYSSFALHFVIH